MLLSVKECDRLSFKTKNDWLNYPISKAIIFSETEKVWKKLKTTYLNDFRMLVYGDLPAEKEIENTLNLLGGRVKEINSNYL